MARLSEAQREVLAYVCEHPGSSVSEVAVGVALNPAASARNLNALYTKRLLGRQHSMFDFKLARFFPEERALAAYIEAREAKT